MASQAIGSLFVSLGLDTATFTAGIKQAQGRIEAFATGLNRRLGALGNVPGIDRLQAGLAAIGVSAGAALGAGAAAAAAGLGALSVNAIDTAKEIKNLSALANASPEEFQKLAYAAQSVGIQQEKLSDILKDMNDRVGDFIATGGGPMKDFFEKIAPQVGVTAKEFRNLSGPQALQLYVSSLEKANVNQQDFAFFMEAIASDSTALVPLLRNGGAAAQQYADRLEKLGGVMSNDTVAKLAAMKTSVSEVGLVLRGLGLQLGAAFAPIIQALAQAFTAAFSQGSLLRGVFNGLASAISFMAQGLAAIIQIIGSFVAAVWEIVGAFGGWVNETTRVGDAITWLWDHSIGFIANMLMGFADLIRATGGFSGALSALADVAVEVWSRIGSGVSFITNSVAAMASDIQAFFIGALNRMVGAWVEFTWAIADGLNSLFGSNLQGADASITQTLLQTQLAAEGAAASYRGAASAAAEAFSGPLSSVAAISDKIAAGANAAGEGMQALGEGIAAADQAAGGGGGKGLKGLKDQMTDLQKATDEWRQTIKGAFTDFITKGGSFKDMLGQIIGKLAEMLASAAFDGLFNSFGGGGFLSGVLGLFGIGGNANGTNNWKGGLTQVNERGGEIMNLPRGTQIIPNDISKRMADSAASAREIKITAYTDEGVILNIAGAAAVQQINRAAPGIVRQSVQATGNAMSSSKSFGARR